MPKPRRILFPRTVTFITSRVQEGLPFVATAEINKAIEGILARACELYPVKIIAYVFMANHFHMMMQVENPEDIVCFMRKIKTETAHLVNRKLGRRQRTVWCSGYDAQTVLTVEDCINKLVYIYTNPQKAGLIEKIEEYPGVSSWQLFNTGKYEKECVWYQRSSSGPVKDAKTDKLTEPCNKICKLVIDPLSWINKVFRIPEEEVSEYRNKIVEQVRTEEAALKAAREEKKIPVMGRSKLIEQPMDKPYSPKSFGRRMWCISWDQEIKMRFIGYVKKIVQESKDVYQSWKEGVRDLMYPPELFSPRFPKIMNMVPFGSGDREAIAL